MPQFIQYILALGPLALGAFLIALAGAKDMKEILHNIIKYAKMEDNLTRMLKELSEFIEFHSGIKQLSNHSRCHFNTFS